MVYIDHKSFKGNFVMKSSQAPVMRFLPKSEAEWAARHPAPSARLKEVGTRVAGDCDPGRCDRGPWAHGR